jgi:hypothetical protein
MLESAFRKTASAPAVAAEVDAGFDKATSPAGSTSDAATLLEFADDPICAFLARKAQPDGARHRRQTHLKKGGMSGASDKMQSLVIA